MCKVMLNNELNGVELYFNDKPDKDAIKDMKANGFRWNGKKFCWYAKQDKNTLAYSEKMGSVELVAVTPVKTEKTNIIDLWALTQYTSVAVTKNYNTKEVAKEIRSNLKNRFKFIKFSVTSPRSSYISIDIKSAPFAEDSIYLKAVKKYAEELTNNYNFCTCYDPYGDYGSSYNFYSNISIDYDYIQTEASEEIKEAIKNYDLSLIEFNKAEKERQEKEYQEYLKEQQEKERQYKIRQEEEKKEIEIISSSVEVVELEGKNQYYVKNAYFANLNKNNTFAQYEEEVAKNDYYLNSLKVTREIKFTDKKAVDLFKNHLLSDFNFIKGTGGSYTEDLRINSMTDYYNMSQEEKNTVEWLLQGIAVYFNNELIFVIDSQGYSYARYVGTIGDTTSTTKEYNCKQSLTPEEVEQFKEDAEELKEVYDMVDKVENSYTHRKNIADMLREFKVKPTKEAIQQLTSEEVKEKMYRVIKDTDTIKDQFEGIELKSGEGITLVKLSMIGGADTQQAYYINHEEESDGKIKLIYKPKNNKNTYSTILDKEEILIYKGWITLPTEVLYDINGYSEITKYGSYDKDAMEEILLYLEKNNIKPIANTFKPVF